MGLVVCKSACNPATAEDVMEPIYAYLSWFPHLLEHSSDETQREPSCRAVEAGEVGPLCGEAGVTQPRTWVSALTFTGCGILKRFIHVPHPLFCEDKNTCLIKLWRRITGWGHLGGLWRVPIHELHIIRGGFHR